jgi:hypothetical protein
MSDAPDTRPSGWNGSPAPRNGLGTAALVLGIIGFLLAVLVIGGLLGIVAVVLGIVALGRVRRGEANNRGVAIGGIVMGALAILLAGIIVAAGAAFWSDNKDEISDLQDCLDDARTDRARDDCAQRFEDKVDANN